jgi:hypothetical protein
MTYKQQQQPIVTVNLCGGLCNRLFQIAAVLGYSEKYNCVPIFYKSLMDDNKHEDFNKTLLDLKVLIPNIVIDIINSPNINQFEIINVSGDIACKYVELQPPKHNNSQILLQGYFQSEKYFPKQYHFLNDYVNKIVSSNNISNLENITNKFKDAYFLHIRMGDYMGHYLHYLGYKKYFNDAIELILNKNPNAKFLICSNEKDKTKIQNEIGPIYNKLNCFYEYDLNPTLNSIFTLNNMGKCQGGICMNSSYSWFGAYFTHIKMINNYIDNDSNSNIVIMPNKWFNEKYLSIDNNKDIYPEWNELTILQL